MAAVLVMEQAAQEATVAAAVAAVAAAAAMAAVAAAAAAATVMMEQAIDCRVAAARHGHHQHNAEHFPKPPQNEQERTWNTQQAAAPGTEGDGTLDTIYRSSISPFRASDATLPSHVPGPGVTGV
jgi:hypothetical protein